MWFSIYHALFADLKAKIQQNKCKAGAGLFELAGIANAFGCKSVTSFTLMCLSIGTPKNNKFSICPKWKIHYFQVSQNLGRVQPHYNPFEYWYT